MKLLTEHEVKEIYDWTDAPTRHYADKAVEWIINGNKYYNSVKLDNLYGEGKLKKVIK